MKLILKKNGSELDVTNKVQSRTLTITLALNDYSASFDLNMTTEELRKNILYIGMDVQIFDDKGERIFGGIVERLTDTYLSKDVTRVRVEVSNYNILAGRFVIIDSVDVEADRSNTAGNLAKKYVLANLSSEGVTEGQVRGGIQLSVIENFESVVHLKKLSQLMDELCTTSGGYYWSIDINKKFNFYSTEFLEQTTHSSDNLIVRPNSIFRDVQFKQDLVNYNNTIYAVGGMADPGTPTTNIDSTGRIVVKAEYTSEIALMSSLNGGNGVWANVFQNDSITSLSELQRFANDLLAQHGERPSTLSFETSERLFEAGDYIFAELGMYFAGKEKFAVDEVMIEHMGKEDYIYYYTCSLRSTNTPKTVSLGTSLKNAMKKEAEKEIGKNNDKNGDCECCCCGEEGEGETNEPPIITEPFDWDIERWVDPSDKNLLVLDENENFVQLTDKIYTKSGTLSVPTTGAYVYGAQQHAGLLPDVVFTSLTTKSLRINSRTSIFDDVAPDLGDAHYFVVFRMSTGSGDEIYMDNVFEDSDISNKTNLYSIAVPTDRVPFLISKPASNYGDTINSSYFKDEYYINGFKTPVREFQSSGYDNVSTDIQYNQKYIVRFKGKGTSGLYEGKLRGPIEIFEKIVLGKNITDTHINEIQDYLAAKHNIY